MKIPPSTHLLLIGDSVTDCGRARPVGEGAPGALGHGYVADLDAWFRACQPPHPVRITNMGVGGDTVRDLAARWDADVLAHRPGWLAVMIGINDVWRHFDPARRTEAVPPDEFRRTYEALLTRTRPQLQGLVLLTPFFIESDRSEPMRARMDAYGAIVAELAPRHGAMLVDTQAAFDRVLVRTPAAELAPDRVHPTPAGHQILARAFLEAAGFPGSQPAGARSS